jgi:hypothetical protein
MTDNLAKGRDSFDSEIGNTVVAFINRNVTPYATSTLGPKFDLVPVQEQKDLMVNAARMHAQQEYNRIMELVNVLQKQASEIQHRLDITDQVRAAKYEFQTYHGQFYWLANDTKHNCTRLLHLGPADWATAPPTEYEYICKVQWLGDYTWQEVLDESSGAN